MYSIIFSLQENYGMVFFLFLPLMIVFVCLLFLLVFKFIINNLF